MHEMGYTEKKLICNYTDIPNYPEYYKEPGEEYQRPDDFRITQEYAGKRCKPDHRNIREYQNHSLYDSGCYLLYAGWFG